MAFTFVACDIDRIIINDTRFRLVFLFYVCMAYLHIKLLDFKNKLITVTIMRRYKFWLGILCFYFTFFLF